MPEDQTAAEAEEARVDQVVGHGLRTVLGSFFQGRQGVAIGLLMTAGLAREGWRAMVDGRPTNETVRLERKIDDLASNMLDVKVKVNAIVDTLPKAQKDTAQQLIRDRMEVLAEARRQVGAHTDQ